MTWRCAQLPGYIFASIQLSSPEVLRLQDTQSKNQTQLFTYFKKIKIEFVLGDKFARACVRACMYVLCLCVCIYTYMPTYIVCTYVFPHVDKLCLSSLDPNN